MIGKQTEERKWFTLEERKAIHKANYGICACRHGQIQDTENSNDVWYHIVEVMRRNILEEVANTLRTKST